jgi:outer membrane murein-binding lipoprotein Lpp
LLKKFGFTGESSLFRDVGEIISKGLYIIFAALGTVLLSVGSAFAGSFDFLKDWQSVSGFWLTIKLILINPFTALCLGGVLFIIGALGTYLDQDRQQTQNKKLASENNDLNKSVSELEEALNSTQEELQEQKSETNKLNKELVTTWLKSASKHLELNSTERATIYYEFDNVFSLLARYSINPEYTKIHRQKFPLNEGVIGKAWQNGKHIEKDCPNSSNQQEYENYLTQTYGYDKERIDTLTMKSCRYTALAIVDADVHVGVIVFESTQPDFFEKTDKVDEIIRHCKNYESQLSKFVRDGLKLDREVTIKPDVKNVSVEDDFIKTMENKSI